MARLPLLIALLVLLSACDGQPDADAYGNFEATEVTVSAESSGQILRLSAREGGRLYEGEVIGLIDTTRLAARRRALLARRRSLVAQRRATLARIAETEVQSRSARVQFETAEEELARTRRLFADEAATARELNQREGEVAALAEQVRLAGARTTTVREQVSGTAAQIEEIEAQLDELDEQMREAQIVNPVAGTVLSLLAERGETVGPGAPLYSVADLDTLTLRAYATGEQLPELRLGMRVEVLTDAGGSSLQHHSGEVSWIADRAQFTPTPIQTRENREELVYAFEVQVPNPEGELKIGMPGEVRFSSSTDS